VGLYPGDLWSGRRVTYTRRRCSGGHVDVRLASDPGLYSTVQTVTASEAGRPVARVAVAPTAHVRLRVPLRPKASGVCVVDFTTSELRVPARVHPGSRDARALGVRFLGVVFGR
jgi:hypothetical protein